MCRAGMNPRPSSWQRRGFVKHWLLAVAEIEVPMRERFDDKDEDHGGKNGGDAGIEALVENEALRFGDFLGGNFSG